MAKLKIHAGDFGKGETALVLIGMKMSFSDHTGGGFFGKTCVYPKEEIESIEVASEENVIRLGGVAGWGVAGGLLLGPVGLLAGALLGGRSKDVTFVAVFKDGKKMLATTDTKTFTQLQALAFQAGIKKTPPVPSQPEPLPVKAEPPAPNQPVQAASKLVDLYAMLGVARDADINAIRQAIALHHNAGTVEPHYIEAAKKVLLNAAARQKYDAKLQQDAQAQLQAVADAEQAQAALEAERLQAERDAEQALAQKKADELARYQAMKAAQRQAKQLKIKQGKGNGKYSPASVVIILLVILLGLPVLTAIAIPAYHDYQKRGREVAEQRRAKNQQEVQSNQPEAQAVVQQAADIRVESPPAFDARATLKEQMISAGMEKSVQDSVITLLAHFVPDFSQARFKNLEMVQYAGKPAICGNLLYNYEKSTVYQFFAVSVDEGFVNMDTPNFADKFVRLCKFPGKASVKRIIY